MTTDTLTAQIKKSFDEKFPFQLIARSFATKKDFDPNDIHFDRSEDIKNFIATAVQMAREEGQKEIMKLANELTEKPDRAVRYVPLDKLFEQYKNIN